MQPFNMFGARSRLFMSNAQMSDWLALIQAITGDWLAIIGAITGLTMVIGSLLLLWFRKIALAKKGSEPEVILERANIFKLDIRNPALGLFILGISFICVSYWFYLHFGVSDKKVRIACTSPEKTDTEIWLTNTVSGLTRTLHFIQGRNPA
jgi:hypothetical protein